ncbi:hypothetical protein B0H15DRAFT_1023677 [Mycena belliarum]|uniref:DUF6533 domain-containing protein n=1 Tax=Mycena belliarum TaxID=1033014 RepID=A0AAD6U1T1_9AGAR|nr:hypothetical protein B0H15DRAFT_1023677 [Mycena belliae]
MPSITPTELAFIIGHVLEGRSFALASFILIFWEYLITLDLEVKHFWCGQWSISRILFLCNRYFAPGLLTFRVLVDFYPGLFPSELYAALLCDIALRINFPLNMTALAIIQGILILRLWYLFQGSRTVRYSLLVAYVWCTAGSITALVMQFPQLHSHIVNMPKRGLSFCADPPPSQFWLVFVPSFVLHGILSMFMIIRVVQNVRSSKNVPLLKSCVRDGGFLYLVIFFSVSFSISAAIVGVSPSVGIVAMFSNFMLGLLSICVSRVILQLSELSAAYSVDPLTKAPALLLHTAMVDRLTWERKMGCLVFVPPQYDEILDDVSDDYSFTDEYKARY